MHPENWSASILKTSRASRCNVLVLSLVLMPISCFKGTDYLTIFDCFRPVILGKKDIFPWYLLDSLEIDPAGMTARLVTQAIKCGFCLSHCVFWSFNSSCSFFKNSRSFPPEYVIHGSLQRVPILPQLGSGQAKPLNNWWAEHINIFSLAFTSQKRGLSLLLYQCL